MGWTVNPTVWVQEGSILDLMSLALSTKIERDMTQSSFEKTYAGEGERLTSLSIMLNKALGFFLLLSIK